MFVDLRPDEGVLYLRRDVIVSDPKPQRDDLAYVNLVVLTVCIKVNTVVFVPEPDQKNKIVASSSTSSRETMNVLFTDQ